MVENVWFRHVSVEPLPKQGCELLNIKSNSSRVRVSVEPLPKQGCELSDLKTGFKESGLSGTPAEAGVRVRL